MGGTCGTHEIEGNCIEDFYVGNQKEEVRFEECM
jgi:hypothetical protein